MRIRLNNIPDNFAYLREATRLYGRISDHDEILKFLGTKTSDDYNRLKEVADRIVAEGDMREITAWILQAQAKNDDTGDAVSNAMSLMGELGISVIPDYESMPRVEAQRKISQEWTKAEPHEMPWLADETRKVFAPAEARDFVLAAIEKLPEKLAPNAVRALYTFPTKSNVEFIEGYWNGRKGKQRPDSAWGTLAALSGVTWPTVERWLNTEGPLKAVALDALRAFCFDESVPSSHARPFFRGAEGLSVVKRGLEKAKKSMTKPVAKQRLGEVIDAIDQLIFE